MRKLNDHQFDAQDNDLSISATDGGDASNPELAVYYEVSDESAGPVLSVDFQDGPIKEAGVNGVTEAALLAIVIDRLRSHQKGPYKSRENAIVLTHLEEAMMWTHQRTRARRFRGVEGTSKV